MPSGKGNLSAPDVGTSLSSQFSYLEELIRPHLRPEQFLYWSNVWVPAVRRYYADLIKIGRDFGAATAASGHCEDVEWTRFQKKIGDIIESHNAVYDSEVISPIQPSGTLTKLSQ